ncbi:SAF domain-containing protein [Pseudoxanthobacter soli DSM 19599]|uniref:SAF domain-containing protein n=1 Tax=Pseudoxanthobacter soli DSM 19599 TaxID=1123029 RepID=A0A1M7Z8H3_9HYPH|nr:UxaA family hydrolase [Pseudoxanthobacter soli]SHO61164.1 SAF domain-containing protein [Pseudoxanthobacter soli DSM 19599]
MSDAGRTPRTKKHPPASMVVLGAGDNVGIALTDIAAGADATSLDGRSLSAAEAIPQGHKIALRPIAAGSDIVRYGMAVGVARADIAAGHLVHIHNVASRYLDNDEDHYE